MIRHRRSWSLSEKLEAVQLMKREGVEKASRQLEIFSTTLYKWEQDFDKYWEQGLMSKPISDKNSELEKLKEENHELKMLVAEKELVIRVQNELLKKSP